MPYSISKDAVPDYVTQLTIYDDQNGKRIAVVFDADAARLFAVAPQLLEVCHTLLGIVEDEYNDDEEAFDLVSWKRAIRDANSIISEIAAPVAPQGWESVGTDHEDDQSKWYIFTAYNSQAYYGYGVSIEAAKWCEHLNRDREINCYQFASLDDADQLARLESGADSSGFNIDDELDGLADTE